MKHLVIIGLLMICACSCATAFTAKGVDNSSNEKNIGVNTKFNTDMKNTANTKADLKADVRATGVDMSQKGDRTSITNLPPEAFKMISYIMGAIIALMGKMLLSSRKANAKMREDFFKNIEQQNKQERAMNEQMEDLIRQNNAQEKRLMDIIACSDVKLDKYIELKKIDAYSEMERMEARKVAQSEMVQQLAKDSKKWHPPVS